MQVTASLGYTKLRGGVGLSQDSPERDLRPSHRLMHPRSGVPQCIRSRAASRAASGRPSFARAPAALSCQRLRRCACRALPPYCREQRARPDSRGSRERRSPERHYRIRPIRPAIDPSSDPAGAVGRIALLRDDPLAAELAGVAEHDRTVLLDVLAQQDSSGERRESAASFALRSSSGRVRRSRPF